MKILLLDDDPLIHETLRDVLKDQFQLRSALDFGQAVRALEADEIDGAIIDLHLPGVGSGVEFLEMFKRRYPDRPAIVQSGEKDTETVVRCIKLGANDFIEKPFELSSLAIRLIRALSEVRKTRVLQRALDRTRADQEIIGDSPPIVRAKALVEQAGPMRLLLLGETGTGKTPFAWYSNQLLARQAGEARALEQINCAGLTREYFQDQLFGHRKGAFTGATSDKRGLVEIAEGGDLFLDEIGEMPLEIQALFLTFLDTSEFYRLGDDQKRKADVRIVCATNRDLREMVRAGTFRKDLYSRIAQVVVEIPPLRERASDLPLLFEHFIKRFAGYAKPYEADVLAHFRELTWKDGNVRELRDAVEYLCVMGRNAGTLALLHVGERRRLASGLALDAISPDSAELSRLHTLAAENGMDACLGSIEKGILGHYFEACGGSVEEMCRCLKMSRPTLYRRLREYRML